MKLLDFGNINASVVLIQPVDDHDLEGLEREQELIQQLTGQEFHLIAVKVDHWNQDLSPWSAPAVFGTEDFGNGAQDFLDEILHLCTDDNKTYYIGGYSLAGLFALWASCRTDRFSGVAAASPSVWFPGFTEYMRKNPCRSPRVYLSLGDKEEKTRNQIMAGVGDCIRETHDLLKGQGVSCHLEWNQGNHFKDPDLRTAKAFAWVMQGIAYGVGVGPGDPELLTLKAVRLIRESDIIAFPGEEPCKSVAYQIAAEAVPEIAKKQLLPICFPMLKDRIQMAQAHEKGAEKIEAYLKQGKNVVFLTLGDSTIYSTFGYLQSYLEADGYQTELVNGIPSFCAAAARLNLSLAEWDEPIHILPAAHRIDEVIASQGTYVLMKGSRRMKEIKELLHSGEWKVYCVENAGMEQERIYRGVENIPEQVGYYSLVILKEPVSGVYPLA